MNEKDKDLMERYIYEVFRRASYDEKEDVRMELEELILEMYDTEEKDMEKILIKLGDPAEVAKKYCDNSNYVIGPGYYDNYVWVLKIVLVCVAVSAVISWIVSLVIGNGHQSVLVFDGKLISSLISAFGMVTLIFAIMERQKVKVELRKEKIWSIDNLKDDIKRNKKSWFPGQMAPVPDKKGLISRGETVFGIVFTVVFGAMLILAPQLFGAYVFDEGKLMSTISIFNLEEWSRIVPLLLVIFLMTFLNEVIRLMTGCYSKMVMVSGIVTAAIKLLLTAVILKGMPIWNLGFAAEVSEQFAINFTSKGDILFYWGTGLVSNILFAIICFATMLEVGTTVYKTIRYGVVEKPYFL